MGSGPWEGRRVPAAQPPSGGNHVLRFAPLSEWSARTPTLPGYAARLRLLVLAGFSSFAAALLLPAGEDFFGCVALAAAILVGCAVSSSSAAAAFAVLRPPTLFFKASIRSMTL